MLLMAHERHPATLCPSEVARHLFEDWREKMEPVRQIARKLHFKGRVEIQQKGKKVKNLVFKGPIRIKASR